MLQLAIDAPSAKRVCTLRGAALVEEEAVVEELTASGEVGLFLFASQLGVVRHERLQLAASVMLAELRASRGRGRAFCGGELPGHSGAALGDTKLGARQQRTRSLHDSARLHLNEWPCPALV